MILSSLFFSAVLAAPVGGGALVATEVIRAGDIVSTMNAATEDGAAIDPSDPVLGREVRRTVYVGQDLSMENTQPRRLVERNQIVTVKYVKGGLEITTSGRAMGEAAAHEAVTVLNLQSRQLVSGVVQEEGWVAVW